jgi:hypothetical protein
MTSNSLLVYGLLEIVVILLPLAGWWYWRLATLQKRLEKFWKAFDKQARHYRRTLAGGNGKPLVARRACLEALERLAEDPPPGEQEHWQALWEAVMRVPADNAQPLVLELDASQLAQDQQSLRELQDVEALLAQQNQQITQLTDYKTNLLRVLQGKFSHIQDSSQELLTQIKQQMAMEDRRDFSGIVARLEEHSAHILGMLRGLEKEQSSCDPQLAILYKENLSLRAATSRNIAQMRDMQEQKLLWQSKSSELAKKLEQKRDSYNRLYRRYESLRRDYLHLIDKNIALPIELPAEQYSPTETKYEFHSNAWPPK